MDAGRELDALVAERVMGFPVHGYAAAWGECELDSAHPEPGPNPIYVKNCCCESIRQGNKEVLAACVARYQWNAEQVAKQEAKDAADWYLGHSWQCYGVVRRYSTDIAAAWEVVEKLERDGMWVDILSDWHGNRRCKIARQSDIVFDDHRWHPTAPHAICLAALKVVGVEVAPTG